MRWLNFILSHSIFIAICAAAFCFQTYLVTQYAVSYWVLGFVFFSTLLSYNLYWNINTFKRSIFFEWKPTVVLPIFSYFILSLISFYQSSIEIKIIAPAVLLNFLYVLPILIGNKLPLFKKIGFAKTLLLAFTWTYVTTVLPINKSVYLLDNAKLIFFIYRFLFMLLLCIIFDKRDVEIDKIKGLHSLATSLSKKVLHIISLTTFLALLLFNYLLYKHGLSIAFCISLMLSNIALGILYVLSTKKRSYLFYYFFVDGLMLLSTALTYSAQLLMNR